MSHVATVEIEFKDLAALKAAVERIGLEWREGQKTFKWYGRFMNDYHGQDAAVTQGYDPQDFGKCEHAIGVPGNSRAYEIGVVPSKSGSGYALLFDYWNGGHGLMEKVSSAIDKTKQGIGKLAQAYATEVAKKKLRQKGLTVREVEVEGKIRLVAR